MHAGFGKSTFARERKERFFNFGEKNDINGMCFIHLSTFKGVSIHVRFSSATWIFFPSWMDGVEISEGWIIYYYFLFLKVGE